MRPGAAAATARFAPGSGMRSTGGGGGASAGSETPWADVQFSKSEVWNILPARVRAYSEAPSGEYQTVCAGPVAGEANPSSMDGLPTLRHSTGGVCAARIPAANDAAKR